MFNLIGSRMEYDYTQGRTPTGVTTKILAVFDSEYDAREYIEKARLKKSTIWDQRPFKRKSLLYDFQRAIVAEIAVGLPHNPTL